MIFVDSNIPMYLVGAAHPNKAESQRLLDACILAGRRLATDVEVFQEILHRYSAINRRDAIQPAFDLLRAVVDEIFPVDMPDVGRAKDIVLTVPSLSARDALHLAVMERRGITEVMSFDAGFDQFPGVTRLHTV